MKKLSILFVAILSVAFFNATSYAQFKIGSEVEDFKLSDSNGAEKSLADLKGKNGTIFVFLSVQCPVVKGYNERLNKIVADYSSKGINFVGINSNQTEAIEKVKRHADETYKFPVLIDKGNVIADKFNAYATPEMFFFDKDNKLVYHGGIDNDRTGENVTINFLRDALEANLAGKTIAKTETRAIGCTIKRLSVNEKKN